MKNPIRSSRPHVLVCGSRSFSCAQSVRACLHRELSPETIIVSGGCAGVDQWALESWSRRGAIEVCAPWDVDGLSAGPTRNLWMVELLPPGSQVFAFWDGRSKGTASTMSFGSRAGHTVRTFDDFGDEVYE